MATNRTECKIPNRSLVAATFEKAKTYVFAETLIRDREVGGSNPLAPTIYFQQRTAAALRGRSAFVANLCSLFRKPTSFVSRLARMYRSVVLISILQTGRRQNLTAVSPSV
jgi:hypothetical protein